MAKALWKAQPTLSFSANGNMPGAVGAPSIASQPVTDSSDSTTEHGREEARQAAWRKFGLPPPTKLDDRLGPAVDKEFLRRFVSGELPEDAAVIAIRLILIFPGWSKAHEEVAAEQSGQSDRA